MQIRTGQADYARRTRGAYLMLVTNGEGRKAVTWTLCNICCVVRGAVVRGDVKRGRVPEGASTVASEPREERKQRKYMGINQK
jgi:hypothetical protein